LKREILGGSHVGYHRIGKRAFERVHAVRFPSIAARLRREWKLQRAA
jgi:hypothetical protein